jgi:hypothetical protein
MYTHAYYCSGDYIVTFHVLKCPLSVAPRPLSPRREGKNNSLRWWRFDILGSQIGDRGTGGRAPDQRLLYINIYSPRQKSISGHGNDMAVEKTG